MRPLLLVILLISLFFIPTSAYADKPPNVVQGQPDPFVRYLHVGFFFAVHGLIAVTMLCVVIFLLMEIFQGDCFLEKLLRAAAAATALLIYAGSRAYGLSIPDLMASALVQQFPEFEEKPSNTGQT
jgi:hypothetical protein